MQAPVPSVRRLTPGLARPAALVLLIALASAVAAKAATDIRKIRCARATTLVLQDGNGTIDIKSPYASTTLKTLYKPNDAFALDAGKEYVLMLNESKDGFFRFDLKLVPAGTGGGSWSCRIRTLPVAPFLGVENGTWSGQPGAVVITMDRTQPLIELR